MKAKASTASLLGPLVDHVVIIIKENHTYDGMLGDMKEGNGDASLCMFGEKVTPKCRTEDFS